MVFVALTFLLVVTGCQTRFAQDGKVKSSVGQSEPSQGRWAWDDAARPQSMEGQALPMYLDLYGRYRDNPDGSFSVPEFRAQANRLVQILDRVESGLKSGRFPLRVESQDTDGADSSLQKRASELSSANTHECFQKIAGVPRGLLSQEDLRYDSFWRSFRLVAEVITRPCQLKIDEKGNVSLHSRFMGRDTVFAFEERTRAFLPFPAIQLPVVDHEALMEQFNSIFGLPLFLVGVSDTIAMVDLQVMDPVNFVQHDFGHSADSFKAMLRNVDFESALAAEGKEPRSGLAKKVLQEAGFIWNLNDWSVVAAGSPSANQVRVFFERRHTSTMCLNNFIRQIAGNDERNASVKRLFWAYHELPRDLFTDVSKEEFPPASVRQLLGERLAGAFAQCTKGHRGHARH